MEKIMAQYRYDTTTYRCSKMKENVTITSKIHIHRSGRGGGIDQETPVQYDCDHCDECDVASVKNYSTVYDWSKCVHPNLKQ